MYMARELWYNDFTLIKERSSCMKAETILETLQISRTMLSQHCSKGTIRRTEIGVNRYDYNESDVKRLKENQNTVRNARTILLLKSFDEREAIQRACKKHGFKSTYVFGASDMKAALRTVVVQHVTTLIIDSIDVFDSKEPERLLEMCSWSGCRVLLWKDGEFIDIN